MATVIIQIRDKTLVINPIKKFHWYVYSTNKLGNQNQFTLTPTDLGISILSMFSMCSISLTPLKKITIVDPDIIMAICYYYEQLSDNLLN